jgi:hypothetical protein
MELAGCYGASAVGVATIDTLAGGPPSTDLTYVLPAARSAISFAVPLNQDDIDLWFSKKSHSKHFKDNIQANPDKDEDFYPALLNAVGPYLKRPKTGSALFNVIMPGDKVGLTCGNCQLICHPDKEVRKARYKMLVESGVVVQNSDGTLVAVAPQEGKKRIAEMDEDTRALYEPI